MQGARPKLLMVINQLSADGGAETQLATLARGLAGRGHEVTLCCMFDSEVPRSALGEGPVELVEIGARTRLARALAVPRLVGLARRADVVHCTMWDTSLWGRIAALLARRPAIVADHATDRSVQVASSGAPRGRWIAAHNRLLDRFTFATVACAASQRPVLVSEGVAPEKIVHIPNGIDVEGLRAAVAAAPGREALGLPAGVPLLLHVGVFRPEKNQLGALEALARVWESEPEAHLAFAGDGATRDEVERRAAQLGAGERVRFLGLRTDVPALLGAADLQLLSSTSDAMPMVILEGMAVGTPAVASAVGDVPEVLGDAGLCVAAGDAEALGDACLRLLGDGALRERMAVSATRRAELFDAARMTAGYEELFAEAARD